jgi:hypothetical protein
MADLPATYEEAINEVQRLQALVAQLQRKFAWAEGRRADSAMVVPGFTGTETLYLRILAARGMLYYEQAGCNYANLCRHLSNIRAKLPDGVRIRAVTRIGYAVEEGRDILEALLLGKAQARLPAPEKRGAIAQQPRQAVAA